MKRLRTSGDLYSRFYYDSESGKIIFSSDQSDTEAYVAWCVHVKLATGHPIGKVQEAMDVLNLECWPEDLLEDVEAAIEKAGYELEG